MLLLRSSKPVSLDNRSAEADSDDKLRTVDVHRFDAQAIPLDGPYGLISHASRLLDNAGSLSERKKKDLLERFVRFVRENQ